MKEVTYGWYPSVKDVYRPKGRPGSYHLECLYKHGESMYYQGQVAPPQPELLVMGLGRSTTPATPQGHRKSRSVPVPKFSRVPKLNIPTPTQCWSAHAKNLAETSWGVVGDQTSGRAQAAPNSEVSWPLPKGKKQHKQSSEQQAYQRMFQKQLLQQHIQQQQQQQDEQACRSPQYAWGLRPASQEVPTSSRSETNAELAWPRAHRPASNRPHTATTDRSDRQTAQKTAWRGQKQRPSSSPVKSSARGQGQGETVNPVKYTPAPPSGRASSAANRPPRTQSATVRREKTPLPARPVTAAPARPETCAPQNVLQQQEERQHTPPSRPMAPVPFIYDVDDNCRGTEEEEYVGDVTAPADDSYEAILDKYGWLAEVHGDPYKLKRPLKRVSYAVECPEPEIPPEPPGVHMETNEPFFLNTIPRRPLSFAVHKEWASEHLLAKRIERQKRDGGIKYSYKKFAFVY